MALRFWPLCAPNRILWSEEYERRAADMRQRAEGEQLAPRLGHERLRIAEATANTGAFERHYAVQDLGALWKLSPSTVARLFRDEPGALKIGRRQARRGRRSYTTWRIPESGVQRVRRCLVVRQARPVSCGSETPVANHNAISPLGPPRL